MNIIQKLANIQSSMPDIPKSGKYHVGNVKYNFLKVDDIYQSFMKPLAEQKVSFYTNIIDYKIDGNLIYGIVEGVFTDGETELKCQVGSAARSGDKMMRNFMQNAVKQIFLQVFCIASGDSDPDNEENTPYEKPLPTPQTPINWKSVQDEMIPRIAKRWDGVIHHDGDQKKGIKVGNMYIMLTSEQFLELSNQN